ncbi:hypothetical protein LSAT2_003701 [Lamellibrachia satsuma]|nr:hypothetical protein LSAT2_003701 [Lamellibrachia satsuma]
MAEAISENRTHDLWSEAIVYRFDAFKDTMTKDTMTKESQQNVTAPSTDELDNADLSDVELKKTDSPQIPVSSHLVMLLEPIMFVYALYIGAISPLSDQYVRDKISKDYNLTVDHANDSGDSSAAVLMTKLTQSTFGDSGLMLIGTISGVAYQAVMAFSVTTLLVFMAPVAGAASNLVAPMVRAISSKLVKQEEEGALFATIALAIALSVLVGQVIFNNIYSATVFVWAPLTFLVMLGTLCFTSLLAVVFLIKEKLEKRQVANSDEEALVNS